MSGNDSEPGTHRETETTGNAHLLRCWQPDPMIFGTSFCPCFPTPTIKFAFLFITEAWKCCPQVWGRIGKRLSAHGPKRLASTHCRSWRAIRGSRTSSRTSRCLIPAQRFDGTLPHFELAWLH